MVCLHSALAAAVCCTANQSLMASTSAHCHEHTSTLHRVICCFEIRKRYFHVIVLLIQFFLNKKYEYKNIYTHIHTHRHTEAQTTILQVICAFTTHLNSLIVSDTTLHICQYILTMSRGSATMNE
jgi:hypothetical protein